MTSVKTMNTKRFGTKIIAFFLAMITILSVFTWIPTEVAAASTDKDSLAYKEFQAKCYAEFFDQIFVDTSGASYANSLLEILDDDLGLRIIRNAWELYHIASEPSFGIGKLTDVERYKLALFDIFLGDTQSDKLPEGLAEIMTHDATQLVGSITKLATEHLNNKNLKKVAINKKTLAALEKVAESTGTQKTLKVFTGLSHLATTYKNANELIQAYANYHLISELKDSTEEILQQMARDNNAPRGLKKAADECASYFSNAFTNLLKRIVLNQSVFDAMTFKTACEIVVNDAWEEFITHVGKGQLSYAFYGIRGIRLLSNAVFDIDKANQLYYALGACVDFEESITRIMKNAESTYKNSPTTENATYYLHTVDIFKKTVLVGFDYCIQLLEHEATKPGKKDAALGEANGIKQFKAIKEANYERFEEITYNAFVKSQTANFEEVKESVSATTAPVKNVSKDAQKIVDMALDKVGSKYANGYCLRFVRQLFQEAYGFKSTSCCAYNYGNSFIDSKSKDDIPLGASVFFGGSTITCSSCKNKCGHIGIYVGDGYIVHGWGGKITKSTIDHVVSRGYPYRGWGWHGNKELTFTDYKISSVFCNETTNNSATINVRLNNIATVQKWTYFLSKDKSQVEKVDGTKGTTHKTVSGMDCVRILDYTSDPQAQTAASFKISKFAKKPLEPNTTYYYKATVKIGSKWYQSGVYSFTTAKVLPAAPSVNVSSASLKIGIGDQATVLWDAAAGAESYSIVVKNSRGSLMQVKNNIKGTTCVLDGLNAADTYTVYIKATNSAGTTEGKSATFTVMPNVTVTFYDPVGKKVIDTRTVSYGHSASAPKNPQQEGHTFSKWDKSFEKVKENITVNAVYDINSYTVKFVDSFTGAVLKSQSVKYNESATAPSVTNIPDGYALAAWDKSFTNIKSDLTVYTVYKWVDKDHSATVTINSVVRNSTKQGYDVTVTLSNKISKISTGRIVFVLKSNGGAILSTVESAAFSVDALANKTMTVTVLCSELAPKIEVYAVNGYENEALGQISKVASQSIDNSSAWSSWISYTGSCPVTSGNGVVVETKQETTSTKYYYRYQIRSTTTSYNTSLSGWKQDGYSLVNAGSGSVTYVAAWPEGFSADHALRKQYSQKTVSPYENATKKVTVSTETVGYIYWHWCGGKDLNLDYNRSIGWKYHENGQTRYNTFHAFFSTEKLTYNASANAYKCKNAACCEDSYWWNGAVSGTDSVIEVKKQTYKTENKLYNYYHYDHYTEWKEYSGNVPVKNNQSAGTNKTYQNVQTKSEPGKTVYFYRYKTTAAIKEPTVSSDRIYTLSGNVGSKFAGKAATVWVYKYDQATNENIQYVGTTTVGSNGSIQISGAKLISAPTVETGDYTIVASVAGQAKAIKLGVIEAPKPKYTVTFYDFDGTTVLSTQTVTQGESATLPSETRLTVPKGHRFTNWNTSVVNVRENMSVYPECETETYVVAFVNWEKRTVDLQEFLYGSELIAERAPEGKDGYITEWVVSVGNQYLTIKEFCDAGYTVSGHMVVETRSTPKKYNVTIVNAALDKIIDGDLIAKEGLDAFEIASESIIENGDYIDFSSVQEGVEDNPDYFFTGWINAYTGKALDGTVVDENMILYPTYTFAMTTDAPLCNVETGEYEETQSVALSCTTEGATIWYTTDSSDPTTSSTAKKYTGPITISKSCVLRYYSSSLGRNDSCEDHRIYAINTSGNTKYHIVTIWSALHDENGSAPAQGLIKDGDLLPVSIFASIEGYDFEGVYYDAEYTNAFDYTKEKITSGIELYAKYGYASYNVTFVDHDGTELLTQNVEYLGYAVPPLLPTREGYIFIGWDKDYSSIRGDITVTALYIPEHENASVALSETAPITLNVGNELQLNATITTDNPMEYEMVWISSNENIIQVNQNGRIMALMGGTATVTVKLPYTGAIATVTVNVYSDEHFAIQLKSASAMGFDSKNNLRAIPLGENTVAQLRTHFKNENLTFCTAGDKILKEDDLVTTGTLIRLYEGTKLIAETTAIVTGDFNCDGIVNNKDIVMINQYIAKSRVANEVQMLAIDVNGDGIVNDRDCATLADYLMSKELLK